MRNTEHAKMLLELAAEELHSLRAIRSEMVSRLSELLEYVRGLVDEA
jgi:hypothetical protein